MIGRSRNWSSPSDFINEFNKKHNPDYYYGKEEKKKTEKKKKTGRAYTVKRHPVFKVSD